MNKPPKKPATKKEGNEYDKIIKENILALFLPLVKRHFGLDIEESEPLDPKFQKTIEREADFLRLAKTKDGKQFILHLEFQTSNDLNMIYRFGVYHSLLVEKYKLPIKHCLIYLGKERLRMENRLPDIFVFTSYDVLNFYSIDYSLLLDSQTPEEIILTVLGDFKGTPAEKVLRDILKKLQQVTPTKAELEKYIVQLQVYSQLRNLDLQTNKIVEFMPIDLDLSKNAAVVKILKRRDEERNEKAIENFIRLGKISLEDIANALNVSLEMVKQIADKINRK